MVKKIDLSPVKEALKEAGRVIIFALISGGIAKLSSLPQTEATMIGTILLKALDKWLAQKDMSIIPMDKARGLSGF